MNVRELMFAISTIATEHPVIHLGVRPAQLPTNNAVPDTLNVAQITTTALYEQAINTARARGYSTDEINLMRPGPSPTLAHLQRAIEETATQERFR